MIHNDSYLLKNIKTVCKEIYSKFSCAALSTIAAGSSAFYASRQNKAKRVQYFGFGSQKEM